MKTNIIAYTYSDMINALALKLKFLALKNVKCALTLFKIYQLFLKFTIETFLLAQ